jgi:HK97 family phage major capsid protein
MTLEEMNLEQVVTRLAELDLEVREMTKVEDVEKAAVDKTALLERKAELDDLETRKAAALAITGGAQTKTLETRNEKVEEICKGASSVEYRNAYMKTLLGRELNEVEKREFAYTNGIGNATAVVPIITSNNIVDYMAKVAPMINEITLMRVAGALRIATEGVRNAAALHPENNPVVPAADTMLFITLGAFEFMKVQRISATVRAMDIAAFEGWLVKTLAEDIAIQLENEIVLGTNVTAGVFTSNAVWGAGNSVQYGAAVDYDEITALIALLPARCDRNAKFLMSKAMYYNQIAQIMDANGNPIAVPDFANGSQMRIMGYPVIISDSVPATDAYLGDFTKLFGNLSQDVTIESSAQSGFLNNSIDFRGVCAFDCACADANAIRRLRV